MNSPYCGWNKNNGIDTTEASDYDFLEFTEEKKVKEDGSEISSYQDSIRNDQRQPR